MASKEAHRSLMRTQKRLARMAPREIEQGKYDRRAINAEAVQVDIHMKVCGEDGDSGLCVLHGWLIGMKPYGWSTNQGGQELHWKSPYTKPSKPKNAGVPLQVDPRSEATKVAQRNLNTPTTPDDAGRKERARRKAERDAAMAALVARIEARERQP